MENYTKEWTRKSLFRTPDLINQTFTSSRKKTFEEYKRHHGRSRRFGFTMASKALTLQSFIVQRSTEDLGRSSQMTVGLLEKVGLLR